MCVATKFASFSKLCTDLGETTKRLEKKRLISIFLKTLEPKEVKPAVSFLIGKPFPESDERLLDVGGTALWEIKTSGQATLVKEPLTILGVAETFDAIASTSGPGSRIRKKNILESLFGRASPVEAKYLTRLLMAEMRIGAVEGVVLEAIVEASGISLETVRRANMLLGSLGEVAEIALSQGKRGLENIGLRLFNPVKPMLAEMSYDIVEAVAEHGGKTAFEWKFDGARVQIHKKNREVRIFSRQLTEVTESVPEIVSLGKTGIHAREALVEGEVVATDREGRPLPFQDLMRRFRRTRNVEEMTDEIPLQMYLFDVLYCNGRLLVDKPYSERWNILEDIADPMLLAPRLITDDIHKAKAFLARALGAGHEGLMAKRLDSDYTPGVRGKKWYKIKPFENLDLVIVAADWGYGRREGWLSNYHLAARDEKTNEFFCLGKTFKGLNDTEFEDMTKRLQALKISETRYTVYVRPEIVVEVAYNEIQKSRQYKSGFALRFARVARLRDDKSPNEADTMTRVKALYEKQFETKGRFSESDVKGIH